MPLVTDRHDVALSWPHIGDMAIDTSQAANGRAGANPMGDLPQDVMRGGRVGRAQTQFGNAGAGLRPLALSGLRTAGLITAAILVILVLLPAAFVAAGP